MAENSHGKKKLDVETPTLVDEVLSDVPEIASVGRSEIAQTVLLPLGALIAVVVLPLIITLVNLRQTEPDFRTIGNYTTIESPLLRSAADNIHNQRRELETKDVQIRRYQDRLLDMDNRLRLLEGIMQENLHSKEEALLREVEIILGEERNRLISLGRSEEQIQAAIDRLKGDLDSDYENRMDEFRSQELELYQTRIEGLRRERETIEAALNSAVAERRVLAKTLKSDEDDLLARLYEERERIDIENAGIRADLEILKESSQAENYWLDELANQYLGLMDAMATQDLNRAERHLTALDNLFSEEMINRLPGISARNQADREIINFFRVYLQTMGNRDLESLVVESQALINQAAEHNAAGRYQEADLAWRRVGALWPLLGSAAAGREETTDAMEAAGLSRFADLADRALTTGNYTEAESIWSSGLERVTGDVGRELRRWWSKWNDAVERRIREKEESAFQAVTLEMNEAAERYSQMRRELVESSREKEASLNAEISRLTRRINGLESDAVSQAERNSGLESRLEALEVELSAARSELRTMQDEAIDIIEREEYQDLLDKVGELETENFALSQRIEELLIGLADAKEEIDAAEQSSPDARWRLYGVITRIVGDAVVVEALTDFEPEPNTALRIMRSYGRDRVIHLANGTLISRSGETARARVSSVEEDSEVFGAPEVDDLIYILAP